MSIQHRMREVLLQTRSVTPNESGLPGNVWTNAGTLRCSIYPPSASVEGDQNAVSAERAVILCPRSEILETGCRLVDGADVYTVEELVRTDRYTSARCRKEAAE